VGGAKLKRETFKHVKGHSCLFPEGQSEFQVEVREGGDFLFKGDF